MDSFQERQVHELLHRSTEVPSWLSSRVIRAAIAVHRELGPGLLESAYQICLQQELEDAGLTFRSEVPMPLTYKGRALDCGFRADLVVQDLILLELKAVDRLLPIHAAQLMTYLKLSKIRVGFLLNFNATPLKNGIRRFVL
jgi:GxxExxY protein